MAKRKHPRGTQLAAENRKPPFPRARPQPQGERASRKTTGGTHSAWFYGVHTVKSALANPERKCKRLVVTSEMSEDPVILELNNIVPEILDRTKIGDFLAPGAVHQGIAGLFTPLPEPDIETACAPKEGARNVVVALDQVTDPQNLGAILRSAAAFGARAVIVTRRHAPEVTGAVAKAASGALETVPLVRVANLSQSLGKLADLGYWRLGLEGTANTTLAKTTIGDNVALVLGAEGKGLRRLTAEHCDLMARLPISPAMESLNVSVAAAIALYELVRS